jgi:hypothetical protein
VVKIVGIEEWNISYVSFPLRLVNIPKDVGHILGGGAGRP